MPPNQAIYYDESEFDSHEENLNSYTYEKLSSRRSIRLLKLHPAARKDQEVICELVEKVIDDEVVNEYEALSWNWGTDGWERKIKIRKGDEAFVFNVPENLEHALIALRWKRKVRTLWVDAICINQKRPEEKNHQVPMMSDIYGSARRVCIWIGGHNDDSKMAIDFIKNEVLKLQGFDELCESQESAWKWRAMLNLMKRAWFERRWVVQEIALANDAELYCGTETISWRDFSDAVQLFVEVETATHRLSDVMRKDPDFYHVPGWFEYVSALGASLLVDATGTLFRRSEDKTKRQALLSLEYLVSNLSVFKASEPRDTIYALLAIAKDTNPVAVMDDPTSGDNNAVKNRTLRMFLKDRESKQQRKRYYVDYKLPFVDICKDFVDFAIRQSSQTDPTRALDILCRPWAPQPALRRSNTMGSEGDGSHGPTREILPSWIPSLSGAAYGMFQHPNAEYRMGRKNADPLVGLPNPGQRNYSAAETKKVDLKVLRFKKRPEYYSMYVSGFVLDTIDKVEVASQSGNIPEEWVSAVGWDNIEDDPPESFEAFWRTLVADRGRSGRNPPSYYGRACKESIPKGLPSGSLNTMDLIQEGRCSVVAEFFRRVQAVIWNRSMIRTTNEGNLGIARKDVTKGDLICILYGCSVPVVLRKTKKSREQVWREREEDETEKKAEQEEKIRQKELEATIRIQRAFRESRQKRGARLLHQQKDTPSRSPQHSPHTGVDLESNFANGSPSKRRTRPPIKTKNPSLSSPLPPIIPTTDDQSISSRSPDVDDRLSKDGVVENGFVEEDEEADDFYWYEFIGECYVHGMMDGEAIEYQNQHIQQLKARTFELR